MESRIANTARAISQVIQVVTFLYPSWRSLSHWKGHLTIPKRSQTIAISISISAFPMLFPVTGPIIRGIGGPRPQSESNFKQEKSITLLKISGWNLKITYTWNPENHLNQTYIFGFKMLSFHLHTEVDFPDLSEKSFFFTFLPMSSGLAAKHLEKRVMILYVKTW